LASKGWKTLKENDACNVKPVTITIFHDDLILYYTILRKKLLKTLWEKEKMLCYGRPILQAWLFPDLNTIPDYCMRENSL
jgi:hypothetical protein